MHISDCLRYLERKQIATLVLQLSCFLTVFQCFLSSTALLQRLGNATGASAFVDQLIGQDHLEPVLRTTTYISCVIILWIV